MVARRKGTNRKPKQVKSVFNSPTKKEAKSAGFADPDYQRPAWRISQLEIVDPFGWHNIEPEKQCSIRGKLKHFEARTWKEILVVSKRQNHSIPVENLCDKARKRLRKLQLEDVDELVSLRLSGKERVWGIRHGTVLMLLWWDPNHLVCPSNKRNT